MAGIVVDKLVQIAWKGTYAGRNWANVAHAFLDEDDTSQRTPLLNDIANRAETQWGLHISDIVADDVLLTEVTVLDIDSVNGSSITETATLTGALTTAPSPPNVAVLVTKVDVHTRSQKNGRWYQVGVVEDDTQSGVPTQLSASRLTAWQTAFGLFLDGMNDPFGARNFFMVVVHKVSSDPDDYTWGGIDSLQVQQLLATQRRRLRS